MKVLTLQMISNPPTYKCVSILKTAFASVLQEETLMVLLEFTHWEPLTGSYKLSATTSKH